MSTSVNVCVIAVTDLRSAVEFYRVGLLFEEELRLEPLPGQEWVELAAPTGHGKVALINAGGWATFPRPGPVLTLSCDDLTAVIQRLRSVGANLTEPVQTPWGLSATVRDPDDQVLLLRQPSQEKT